MPEKASGAARRGANADKKRKRSPRAARPASARDAEAPAEAGFAADAASPDEPLARRRMSILGTVVYEYIATGEPVGSATLTQKYNLGVSPATVRAEMASLEEEGYLDQPHTSAGRVPSDRGYRFYVDRIMLPESITAEEQSRIRAEVSRASRQLDTAIDRASHILSDLTKNIAFAIAPRLRSQIYRHLELIAVASRNVHIVLVTDLGLAAQSTVEVQADVPADTLTAASNAFNARFAGRPLSSISQAEIDDVARQTPLPQDLLRVLAGMFARHGEAEVERRLFAGGANNLLDQQEFRDLRKLRAILDLLEEQRTLHALLSESIASGGARIAIGSELGNADMTECSVVTVPYKVGSRNVGAVGVLGPRRMQYARLIALISCMADSLNALFAGDGIL
ncbi:MAG TPA: heat-inducible transcriptional repressor HrcA [Candidatus Eremiobacteraceae bacterium]|nr:heat-inducible transcriptional repressor HrcA [Candidatus Eremiobacteraceae bacterium]